MTESRITEVSVYKSGAIIKRCGTVHLEKGSQTVKIKGLKAAKMGFIPADSVKLAVDNRIIGSNVQVEAMADKDVKDTLRSIQDQINEKNRELEILELQETAWKDNADFKAKESVSIEAMVGYIEALEERLKKINEKKAALGKDVEELTKQYQEHEEWLREPYVKADLCCEEEGDYGFELTYFCNDVFWTPFYEIHTDDSTDNILIKLRAKVCQNTVEDWEKVKLHLYPTDPSLSGTIPTLYPNRLSFYTPAPERHSLGMGMMKMAMAAAPREEAMEDAAFEMPMNSIASEFKTVSRASAEFKINDSILEYDLAGTWDVPSSKEIICDLTDQSVSCRYHDICVPKLDTKVYLAAEVKTADAESLMDTNASIYIKGTYMGDAYIEMDPSKELYDISLGIDETVKILRKRTKRFSSNVLLKGQKKIDFEFEITASSKKDRKCDLTIIDQIPVSEDKTIEITQGDISGGEYDEKTGEVKWNISLEPSETAKKILSYSVAYPKDKTVNNL